jgi:hypothetical protein
VTTVLPLESFKQQAQKGLGNKRNTEKNRNQRDALGNVNNLGETRAYLKSSIHTPNWENRGIKHQRQQQKQQRGRCSGACVPHFPWKSKRFRCRVCGRCCYVPTSVRDPRAVLCGNVEAWCSDSGMRKCAWGKYAVHWGAQTGCSS